jgi:hypothetical protein
VLVELLVADENSNAWQFVGTEIGMLVTYNDGVVAVGTSIVIVIGLLLAQR